jgi:hypothetical protein
MSSLDTVLASIKASYVNKFFCLLVYWFYKIDLYMVHSMSLKI